ncbi:MAG TPA: ABC transporter substrate-binding protein [Actinomycetes bacterium]|nr:ABC transporter substrate-binding protein [Actinomycetes bacterium]
MRTVQPAVRAITGAVVALIAATSLAACAQKDASPTPAASGANACDNITTKQDGVLTVATSNPAYPPYVLHNDPTNGKGFESATAYAVAAQMGFDASQVEWTYAPFNKLFAPGEKDYDFAINQIGITPERERAVTFSDPYYEAANAALVMKDSPFSSATTLADLQDAKIGVQSATTAQPQVEAQIAPTQDVAVYQSTSDATHALENGQIDVFVTDLPTTLYLATVKIDGVVVGQLPGDEIADRWGLVLQKDNPLVGCVNASIKFLQESQELVKITDKWMRDYVDAPVLG